MGGAELVALSLALPHPGGANAAEMIVTATAMALAGVLCLAFYARIPLPATHLILAATAAATGLVTFQSGVAAGVYGTIFVWSMLISAYYFSRRVAAAHLVWILIVYGLALAIVPSTAGYSPLTRWLFTAISLTVVMALTNRIVAHRAQADQRARRFFDLSHDMLSTMDREGRCVEVNGAWKQLLGYGSDELQGRMLLELTHPDDHRRALAAAAELFKGAESVGLESRVRAKDGSWHWLRSSSAFAPEDGLVYTRSTDVTELRRIEAEREELLEEVESLARSDALTGLPNRRALDEQMPREMARARRSQSPLCLAIVDIDHFKLYNDSQGHLAGDVALRECAVAWDSVLRGEDTIVRFGGEEFVVVIPDCIEQAAEIVERLREATPQGQTCSAGLACWDFTETIDELIGRADAALYEAKAGGRDRLVHTSS
ncbi:MAG: GGDEF domain-containing protein [Solirubrobacterales bacterium]|nr:GGDEF domain-containing protein [Solirubrobacterales bacterium]